MQTITPQVRRFVLIVVTVATLATVKFADQIQWGNWQQLVLLFGMIVVASSVRIADPRGWSVTPSTALFYLAMFVLNPPTALLVAGSARTIGYVISKGWVPWRALFNGAQIGLSVAAGAFAFRVLGGDPQRIVGSHAYIGFLAAPVVHQIANNFFVAYGVSSWRGTPFLITWFDGIRDQFTPNLLSIPTATILAVMSARYYTAILLLAVVVPLQWRALHYYFKLRQLNTQIFDGLVVATDVNFPSGRGHSRRVADLTVAITREMQLSEAAVQSIQFAALLHDVGMIGKDDILDRPVLTSEDSEGLRDHVRVGAEIARELPGREIATMILRHHEHYDGTGYPGGLKGEAIPLGARVIAVAEAVDSMASGTFPYTTASSPVSIVSHVAAEKGRTFDPEIVDAFLKVVERGSVGIGEIQFRDGGLENVPRLGEEPSG